MPVEIKKILWGGWPNCYLVSNGEVELIVTSDVGPRIVSYRFVTGGNIFKVYENDLGKSGESTWQFRGGHRLWIAPEVPSLTHAADNWPVEVSVHDTQLTLTSPVEPNTGLQKQITIRMDEAGSGVEVTHRIENRRDTPFKFAIWALTVMATEGVAVTGFPPRGRHEDVLAPTNPLIMWAFTDLSDPRWTMLEKYLILRQDPAISLPTKLGHFNPKTWGAYFLNGDMFLKRYDADPSRAYTDLGCSYETFTRSEMLEIETLGPLENVAPGHAIAQIELWSLHKAAPTTFTQSELDHILQPILNEWLRGARA
ncbi:MAG: hypothetical protein JWN34_5334 [Bryobacterales bacterium]|nr:hypothetical protein [Bryobacterales bacterium]